MANPVPLGKITVVTPGTLVDIWGAAVTAERGQNKMAHNWFVQWVSGTVYVGRQNLNRTTLANVYVVLSTSFRSWQPPPIEGSANSFPLDDIRFDADGGGDSVLFSYVSL